MKVKTVWEYSEKTEAERLLSCAHQISIGFYRINNFIVLPYAPKVKTANIVTFPDLPYHRISRFWDKVKKIDTEPYPMVIDKKLLADTISLISTLNLPKPNYQKIINVWEESKNTLLSTIFDMVPTTKTKIKKIYIYPTVFGTSTSFDWIDKTGEIFIWLRDDQGLSTLVEAILSAATRKDVYTKLDGIWQESEIIVDWLVTQTKLTTIIQKYDRNPFLPTMKGVRIKQQAKLLEESDNFYKKLGLPTNRNVFALNGLTPEINKKPLENLSPTEKVILRLLIQKAGGVVTFDEFGNELFKDEGDFSLYAISKNIERLRNKLEANGISGSYIQTLRGKGYLLKN